MRSRDPTPRPAPRPWRTAAFWTMLAVGALGLAPILALAAAAWWVALRPLL